VKNAVTLCEPPGGIAPLQFPLKPAGYEIPLTAKSIVPVFAIVKSSWFGTFTVPFPKAKSPLKEINLVPCPLTAIVPVPLVAS
jgi:hypothetical protein